MAGAHRWVLALLLVAAALGLLEAIAGAGGEAAMVGGGCVAACGLCTAILVAGTAALYRRILPAGARDFAVRGAWVTWVVTAGGAWLLAGLSRAHRDGALIGAVVAAVIVALAAGVLWVCVPARGASSEARGSARRAVWPLLATLVVWAAVAIVYDALRATPVRVQRTRAFVAALDVLSDPDLDGFGHLAHPRDCAPFSAEISPGVRDIAGNGLDENCDGQD